MKFLRSIYYSPVSPPEAPFLSPPILDAGRVCTRVFIPSCVGKAAPRVPVAASRVTGGSLSLAVGIPAGNGAILFWGRGLVGSPASAPLRAGRFSSSDPRASHISRVVLFVLLGRPVQSCRVVAPWLLGGVPRCSCAIALPLLLHACGKRGQLQCPLPLISRVGVERTDLFAGPGLQ